MDSATIQRLYTQHNHKLFKFALGRACRYIPMTEAEALVHDVWLKLIRLNTPPVENQMGFLWRSTINMAHTWHSLSRQRKEHRSLSELMDIEIDDEICVEYAQLLISDEDVCEHHIHNENAALVRQALAALPVGERNALVLHHLHDLSYNEIAAYTGYTRRQVQRYLQKAHDSLRARLRPLVNNE